MEEPVEIIGYKTKQLRNRNIHLHCAPEFFKGRREEKIMERGEKKRLVKGNSFSCVLSSLEEAKRNRIILVLQSLEIKEERIT